MAGRNPVRFIAPLALVAFGIALYIVLSNTMGGDEQPANTTRPVATAEEGGGKKQRKKDREEKPPKTYTVEAGDTPSGIAEDLGVDLDALLAANPDLDPNVLVPGTELEVPR